MEQKKIGYILVIISLIIIMLGTIFFLVDSNKTKEKEEKNKTPDEIVEKEEKSLKDEHCLENICFENMAITGNYHEYYHASADITNKSANTVNNKYIKALFEVDGKTHVEYFYIEKLESNESINIDIGLSDDKLLNATSYQLENPTAKEIEEQEALLVD